MRNIGWTIVGTGPETRIAEFRAENPDNNFISYEEAKAKALQRLKEHISPYLARIEELEDDLFAETGALPSLKAWRKRYGNRAIVIAKTKKRAMEIAWQTRHGFDSSWDECDGDWWYHLAGDEAVWVEEQDDRKRGTGVFYKPLDRDETEQILEQLISPYRSIDIAEVLGQVGQTSTDTGVSSQGTPYKITIKVQQEIIHPGQEGICVRVEIDDCLGWHGWYSTYDSVYRELPELAIVGTEVWTKEGI